MIDHIYQPSFQNEVTLTLDYSTVNDISESGLEMRTAKRYKPAVSYTYTLEISGKNNVLKRRFEAEKELYNLVRVPVFALPFSCTVISPNLIDVGDNPIELINRYIYCDGLFYPTVSAFNSGLNGTYRVGLAQNLPISSGSVTIFPVLVAKKNDFGFSTENLSTWTRKETIVWQSL